MYVTAAMEEKSGIFINRVERFSVVKHELGDRILQVIGKRKNYVRTWVAIHSEIMTYGIRWREWKWSY